MKANLKKVALRILFKNQMEAARNRKAFARLVALKILLQAIFNLLYVGKRVDYVAHTRQHKTERHYNEGG